MKNAAPVMSALQFYDRRGLVASSIHRRPRNLLRVRSLRRRARTRTRALGSRDLSTHAHPSRPRPFLLALHTVLTLLLGLTGCAPLREPTLPQYFVLTLPASIGVYVAATLILMCLALLGGFFLGERDATRLLRAADSAAAAQYQRQEIAGLLDASSAIHDLTEDIVLRAHGHIRDLRTQLEHLKKEQR